MRTAYAFRGTGGLVCSIALAASCGTTALLLALSPVAGRAAEDALSTAGGLPRYQFKVGQQLHYTSSGEFKYENGSIKTSSDLKAWVTRQNHDGSWRVVVKKVEGRGEDTPTDDSRSTLAYVDLFPDGRFIENATIGYNFDPRMLFPRLPDNEVAVTSGWQARAESSETTFKYSAKDVDASLPVLWRFACVQESPSVKIYETTLKDEIDFDLAQGAVREMRGTTTQKWGVNGAGTSRLTLKEISESQPDWIAALDRDLERYLATMKQEEALMEKAGRSPQPELVLDEVKACWTKLRGEITNEEIAKVVDSHIKQQDSTRSYYIETAKKRAEIVGKPAADWNTTDLEGKQHRLADYAGKVVVLDFWYRGCGWCIRAMPQVNQVAQDFAGQPVTMLGMNTDSKLEDAKFVDEAMELKYPSLRIDHEFAQKYGVSGFPSFVIIDGAGNVRDVLVGYSPTLREKLTASINDALKKPAAAAAQ